jgi:DNA invertase Pin-like site-specific DNA recombinase
MRVALYARVSTRDRDQDPELQLQLQPMREYAAARGWRMVEYVDQASAADMAGRRGWAQLLEDVRRRRVDHVMAWKLDRPFRLTLHCLRTLATRQAAHLGDMCSTSNPMCFSRFDARL